MRKAGGIVSIIGGIYALAFGILLARGGLTTGIAVLILGAVAIRGGICAFRRQTYPLALIGAICVMVAKFLLSLEGEWGLFVLGILSLILIIRSRQEFGKVKANQSLSDKGGT